MLTRCKDALHRLIAVRAIFRRSALVVIEGKLIEEGFIDAKVGGYQFIFEDHMCKLAAPLSDYVPEGEECMNIRIHGLLIVLT